MIFCVTTVAGEHVTRMRSSSLQRCLRLLHRAITIDICVNVYCYWMGKSVTWQSSPDNSQDKNPPTPKKRTNQHNGYRYLQIAWKVIVGAWHFVSVITWSQHVRCLSYLLRKTWGFVLGGCFRGEWRSEASLPVGKMSVYRLSHVTSGQPLISSR